MVLQVVPVEVLGALMSRLFDNDVDGAWMALSSAAERGRLRAHVTSGHPFPSG